MRREASRLLVLMLAVLSLACFAFGQTQPNLENGFKSYGSYDGSKIDTVGTMNGNLILHAPVLPDYPQRGGKLSVPEVLYMSSKNWQVICPPGADGNPLCQWSTSGAGVNLQTPLGVTVQRTIDRNGSGTGTTTYTAFGYSLTGPDNAVHQLYPVPGSANIGGDASVFESVDTSGYRLQTSNPDSAGVPTTMTVTDRQGSVYQGLGFGEISCGMMPTNRLPQTGPVAPVIDDAPMGDQYCPQAMGIGSAVDSNGNQYGSVNSTVAADTLGRAAPISGGGTTADYSGCASANPIVGALFYNYIAPDGSTHTIKFCYANYTLQTFFNQSGVLDYQNVFASARPPVPLPVTAVLADGSKWTIDYDSYGEIVSVGLPMGGSLSYTWTTISMPPNSSYLTWVSRAVATRTIQDGQGHSYTWNYNWGTVNNGIRINTVTDPLGNDTVHVFTALDGTALGQNSFFETSTREYQGTGGSRTLLKQVDTAYSSGVLAIDSTSAEVSPLGNVVPISIQTAVYPSGKVSKVTKQYDTGLGANAPIFDNVTVEKEYDWGQGAPGALLRETDTTYQWQVNSAYLTAHLLDLPASVIVKDGAGCALAETDYTYDESAYLTSANINTQHVGPPYGVRGNLTTVTKWLASTSSCNPKGGTAVVSHTNWYDTGEVYQQIDPLGHVTTHSYDPAYIGAYSTKTCDPVSHCVSGTYDFNTGVLTSFTNQNATQQASGNTPGDSAHTSNYAYDFMWRLTSALAPPDPNNSGARAQTNFSYSSANIFPLTVTRASSITNALTDSATATFDGFGRPVKTQHAMSGGTATVDTVYDALGQVASVSNPYFSTSDPTYGLTQTQYDALGRATQVTEQDGSVKAVAYNMTPVQAIAGDCTQTMDEAGTQRRACSDGLGRLIEVDEPGDSYAGSQAQGVLSVNGSLQSTIVGVQNAAQATGSVTIQGGEESLFVGGGGGCDPGIICDGGGGGSFIYDAGTISITVNGHTDTYSYGQNDTPDSIASGLVAIINGDSAAAVTASPSGATVNLTSKVTGTASDYSFSSAVTYDTTDFSAPSFTTSVSGATLAGGANGSGGTTVYDAGTVTVTIGGFTASASYSQSGNSTAAAVATALAGTGVTGLSRSGSPVQASASGSAITITYNAIGTAGNVAVTCSSSTSQGTYFASPSFTCPGITLSGGFNPEGASLDHNYLVTQYSYDALGNLLQVTQKGDPSVTPSSQWRVRNFTYDSLSRLLTAQNPESGTITYSYDADGELLQKTSPAPNQTGSATQTISYCHDTLGRVTGRAYSAQTCQSGQLPSGTAVVSYVYDNAPNAIGKLVSLTDQAGSAGYNYDVLGRVSSEQRTLNGVQKGLSYAYNLDGSLKSLTYPSGAVVTYALDSDGRDLSAIDGGNGINYVTAATYGPDNALNGFVSGNSGSFAGITSSFTYNKRLQPMNMSASSPSQTVFSIGYDFHVGSGDNGTVYGLTNYKDATRNQTFTYDALNRLTSAQNAGADCTQAVLQGKTKYWGNAYGYDAWGNLLSKTVTKCGAENLSVTALANNQLAGYGYDAAGNMTSDPTDSVSSTYDQENRIAAVTKNGVTTTYIYDGDGNRVKKANGTAPADGTLYWSMTPGIVAESDLAGNLQSEYVFFDGERIARRDYGVSAGVSYYFSDHLKTASVITDAAGNIKSESDYYPWGGELQFISNDSNHYKFTGKERDSESGLDYFGARYYSNGLGRFISADWDSTPIPVPYADLGDPQTFNLYTYVRNIPTSQIDGDGHCPCSLLPAMPIKRFFDNAAKSGSVKGYLKDTAIGLAKGAGSAAYHTLMSSTPITLGVDHYLGEPKALQASNQSQADAKFVASVTVGAAGGELGAEVAAESRVGNAARATADGAQAEGRASGTAAALETKDGKVFTDVSVGKGGTPGPNHPEVQAALDSVPEAQRSPYHGGCGEIGCLNQAKNAGSSVRGGRAAAAKIRKPGHPSHGQSNPPCSTCRHVMDQMGVGHN